MSSRNKYIRPQPKGIPDEDGIIWEPLPEEGALAHVRWRVAKEQWEQYDSPEARKRLRRERQAQEKQHAEHLKFRQRLRETHLKAHEPPLPKHAENPEDIPPKALRGTAAMLAYIEAVAAFEEKCQPAWDAMKRCLAHGGTHEQAEEAFVSELPDADELRKSWQPEPKPKKKRVRRHRRKP